MSTHPTHHTEQTHLRYVHDTDPGITRKRHGKGFRYIAPGNEHITNAETLERIRALAIPPTYRSVWICTYPNGHLQATARDDRRRKQYRYHSQWEEIRTITKFDQMAAFADALPELRQHIERDMALTGLPRERVLATIIHLMDVSQHHIGADTADNHITFAFIGKGGKEWQRDITDRKVTNTIKQCEDLPGQHLFKYIDEQGARHDIASDDVNAYLQEITGHPFTAKDFRTWSATAHAIETLAGLEPAETKREHKAQLSAALKDIAELLGHTPTICRKSYIHPGVLEGYESGELKSWFDTQQTKDDHKLISAFLARQ